MSDICNTCGLPKELCVCETIAKEQSKEIEIKIEKRKFGKMITVVSGIDAKEIDVEQLVTDLKKKCACGGTFKEGKIELQGNQKYKVKEELQKLGFAQIKLKDFGAQTKKLHDKK